MAKKNEALPPDVSTPPAAAQQHPGPAAPAAAPAAVSALEQLERETQDNDAAVATAAEKATTAGAGPAPGAITDAEALAGAQVQAAAAVAGLSGLLEQRYPYLQVPEKNRQQLTETLAPVLVKHGAGMPEWLIPYKEEFALGMALAGTAFGLYLQVQAHNAALQAEAEQKAKADQARGQGAAAVHGHPGPAPAPAVQARPPVDLSQPPAVPAHLAAEL